VDGLYVRQEIRAQFEKMIPPYPFKKGEQDMIVDDRLAQTVMVQMGVWEFFTKEEASTTTISMTVVEDHPTHWCLCARHRHNPDPAENGFQIIAYPKESAALIDVQFLMQRYLASATEVSVEFVTPKPFD
jgi:hypothetical protein